MGETSIIKLLPGILTTDEEEVDIRLAQDFFKRHGHAFHYVTNGKFQKDYEDRDILVYDNKNNAINPHQPDGVLLVQVNELDTLDSLKLSDILNKIADMVEENSKLFAQIDFAIRGINPKDVQSFDIPAIAATFRYYANCCIKTKYESHIFDSKAFVELFDHMPLASLGWLVAPALASNFIVNINCTPNITAAVTLFAELCLKSGLPVQALSLFPKCKSDPSFSAMHRKNELRDNIGSQLKDIMYPKPYRGTMIVSESADIDSAVDNIFGAAWSHNGMLSWSLKRILVQESVLEKFNAKLTIKIKMHKLKKSSSGILDNVTAKAINSFLSELAVHDIKPLGLHESFEGNLQQNYVKPIIFVDSVPLNIEEMFFQREVIYPIVFVQPYRTTKEAISMVNSKPTVAVSVWCDRITVGNEFLGINTGHIWYNCFGLFSFNIDAGWAFLLQGGFVDPKMEKKLECADNPRLIEKVTKAQKVWKLKLPEQRAKAFLNVAKKLSNNFELYVEKQIGEYKVSAETAVKILEESIKFLQFAATESLKPSSVFTTLNKTLHIKMKEPLGIISVNPSSNELLHEFIISISFVTLYGNGAIYETCSPLVTELSNELFELGIPVIVTGNAKFLDVTYNAVEYSWSIYSYRLNSDTGNEHVQRFFDHVHYKDIMERKFINVKSVWSTIGETYAN